MNELQSNIAIRIDNLQFDEGSDEASRLDLMVKDKGSLRDRFWRAENGHPRWANAGSGKTDPLQRDRYRGADGQGSASDAHNLGR